MSPSVLFAREIRQGHVGEDVIGHKRALSRVRPDLYPWTAFTDLAGDYFIDAVVKYKRQHGLGATRVLGTKVHALLEKQHRHGHPSEWAFDATAVQLCKTYYERVTKTPEERCREAIVNAAFFWYGRRSAIRYSQWRPIAFGKPPWTPTRWDCSGFVTACHCAGGAHDPNGRGYDGQDYTGTLMSHGVRVASVTQLKPGDLIFYGYTRNPSPAFPYGSPTHVSLYVGFRNGTHMTLSMGSYPMSYIPVGYRGDVNCFRSYTVV